jgi:hypothetical protein
MPPISSFHRSAFCMTGDHLARHYIEHMDQYYKGNTIPPIIAHSKTEVWLSK